MPTHGRVLDSGSVAAPSGSAFADIIVPRHLHRTFTYGVPAALQSRIRIGSLVRVPLGPSTVSGVVIALSSVQPQFPVGVRAAPIRMRDILAVADEPENATVSPDVLELSRQVAEYYLAPWGQCVRLILPAAPGARETTRPRRTSRDRQKPFTAAPPTELLQLPAAATPAWWPCFQEALAAHRHETFIIEDALQCRWATVLHAAEIVLARANTVLIISPEIRRAAALAALCLRRWPDRVSQLHSDLPPAVRAREWHRIQSGAADIVVGTRSAVFAPLRSPGLICVDDEDDPSLKEEQEPHYHAREVAAMRARQHGAVLLLGTAHSSVETWQHIGIPHVAPPQAAVRLVDLRQSPPRTLLSEPMLAGIRAALETGTGAILFANRKGFAAALHCRDCGASPACLRCSVSLALYKRANRLACRYCGATEPIPETCPTCRSSRVEPVGSGTERLEEELRRSFPGARIGRLDRDTARTPEQALRLRNGIAAGELDVLIGTQMLFQDMPVQPVGFVGMPYADTGLHRPDFRSSERTYHALRDAVGLARTGGQVVLQTILPDHHVIASIATGDPARFYEQELAFRRALGYPPFAHLISLCVSGKTHAAVRAAAERWAAAVKERGTNTPRAVMVLGPIPATVERVRGRHRWQILVKSSDGDGARHSVKATLEGMEAAKESRGLKFDVIVDPMELG
ncbi:MAG TPA: primosomal protein N' [Nitrospiraceae bacterium]|nr:primosomal protein N' [Nitrospiraceae bacterium]